MSDIFDEKELWDYMDEGKESLDNPSEPQVPEHNATTLCGKPNCLECTKNPYQKDMRWIEFINQYINHHMMVLAPIADLSPNDGVELGAHLIYGYTLQMPLFDGDDVRAYGYELARNMYVWGGGTPEEVPLPEGYETAENNHYKVEAAVFLECSYSGDFQSAVNVLESIKFDGMRKFREDPESFYEYEEDESADQDKLAVEVGYKNMITFLALLLNSVAAVAWENMTTKG